LAGRAGSAKKDELVQDAFEIILQRLGEKGLSLEEVSEASLERLAEDAAEAALDRWAPTARQREAGERKLMLDPTGVAGLGLPHEEEEKRLEKIRAARAKGSLPEALKQLEAEKPLAYTVFLLKGSQYLGGRVPRLGIPYDEGDHYSFAMIGKTLLAIRPRKGETKESVARALYEEAAAFLGSRKLRD